MFFTKKKVLIMIINCLVVFIFTYNDVKSEEIKEITGYTKIIDGDTIKISSKKIRLHGIDAPEKKQTCKKSYLIIGNFSFTKNYLCGEVSTNELSKKITSFGTQNEKPIIIVLKNNAEFMISFLAVTKTNSIAAPLNPDFTEEEFNFYLDDINPSLIITTDGHPVISQANAKEVPYIWEKKKTAGWDTTAVNENA